MYSQRMASASGRGKGDLRFGQDDNWVRGGKRDSSLRMISGSPVEWGCGLRQGGFWLYKLVNEIAP